MCGLNSEPVAKIRRANGVPTAHMGQETPLEGACPSWASLWDHSKALLSWTVSQPGTFLGIAAKSPVCRDFLKVGGYLHRKVGRGTHCERDCEEGPGEPDWGNGVSPRGSLLCVNLTSQGLYLGFWKSFVMYIA